MSQSTATIDLTLHPKQGTALQSPATEILYGGAAGGGKSHLMRVVAIVACAEIPGLQVYLFRRIRDDLVKNHIEGPKGLRAMLAAWANAGLADIIEDEIRFWNGSKIYLCHCKDEKDRFKYLGAEIHLLLIDELTTFTEVIYRFLRGRVRQAGLNLPEKYKGMFPRILSGSNPGNIGHLWVKSAFVDSAAPMSVRKMDKRDGGMLRQYIPAKLDDNPSLVEDDPDYEDRLEGLGSEALVRALRHGDWDVIEGAFFDCWDQNSHVIRPATLPEHWVRFRAMDWGSARPFSVGWYAVASEAWQHPRGPVVPRGSLVRYREWYGMREGSPNTGVKMFAEDVAKGIVSCETKGERISYGVLDPAAFAQDGGPSLAERMTVKTDEKAGKSGLYWRPADNKRVSERGRMGGWDQVRARLEGEDDRPMLYIFDTCVHLIRTLPALQHDENKPEDVNTESEDHAPDELRYACMSRPYTRPKPGEPRPVHPYEGKGDGAVIIGNISIRELIRRKERARAGE